MFVSVVDAAQGLPTVVRDGLRTTITVPLARSSDDRQQVALDVRLWGGHWRGVAVHEFKFAIIVLDLVTGELKEIFDRYEAAPYLVAVRDHVLRLVCVAADALIQTVKPQLLYRATHLTRPSGRSLEKHAVVTKAIMELGYGVLDEGTDSIGRHYWIMQRSLDA